MFPKGLALSVILVLGISSAFGLQGESAAALVQDGQDCVYRLDYPEATRVFHQMIQQAPDDPAGYGMLAIVCWNELLFRAGNLALDDYATPTPFSDEPAKLNMPEVRAASDRFHEANDQLLSVCDRRLGKYPKDVVSLYFKGVHFENLAAEAIAVTKSSNEAIRCGNQAKKLHEQVLALDPGFTDAYVSLATHEFARATLPWSIKWVAFLLGIRGDKERAFQRLELVAAKGVYRRLDSQVILALLHSWKGDAVKAVAILRDLHARYPQNHLIDINMAAILEQKRNDPQAALQIYKDLVKNRESKAWSFCPGEIHYRMGKLYLRMQDASLALSEFQQALQNKRAERETEPLAYFRMAQIHENRGNRAQASDCYRRVLQYQGTGLAEELRIARSKTRGYQTEPKKQERPAGRLNSGFAEDSGAQPGKKAPAAFE